MPNDDMIQRAKATPLVGVVAASGVALKRSGDRLTGLCPFHAEKTPSFTIYANQNRYHCFGCGTHGDVIDYVMRDSGRDFAAAVRSLTHADLAAKSTPKKRGDPPRPTHLHKGITSYGHSVWNECRLIRPDDPAGRYLANRGCALPPDDGHLRWHPELLHHPTGTCCPALVALVTDAVTSKPLTLHRTYLARDGSGKAPVEPTRMLLPNCPKAGGAVRLSPDSAVTDGLAVGEGLETCLTVMRGFVPVWCCLDAGNLGAFPVLGGIDCLTIIADNDLAGLEGAERCAKRWTEADRDVRVWRAGAKGHDFNDWAAT